MADYALPSGSSLWWRTANGEFDPVSPEVHARMLEWVRREADAHREREQRFVALFTPPTPTRRG